MSFTEGKSRAHRMLPKRWNQITSRLVEFYASPRASKKCVNKNPFTCTSLCFDSWDAPIVYIRRIKELVFSRLGQCNRFKAWEKYVSKLVTGYNNQVEVRVFTSKNIFYINIIFFNFNIYK